MNRLILLVACLPLVGYAAPGTAISLPDLIIKKEQNRKPKLVDLEINVTIEGNLAETVLELNYYNEGRWNAEGEFTLQLPAGATVSTYALDVNGHMRPGVSVKKEQARHAYETIKRQNIDPGLVEREKNNIYRTRIFPILPRKHKKVRIGFTHTLDDGEYLFPFTKDIKVENLKISMEGTFENKPKLSFSDELIAPEQSDEGIFTWSFKNQNLDRGELKARTKQATEDRAIHRFDIDSKGNLYFVTQGKLDDTTRRPEEWDNIRIIWDASLSCSNRDDNVELAAIYRILKFANAGKVKVHFLRERLDPATLFNFENGDSKPVIAHLKNAVYHGNADFSKIEPYEGKTILVSDGRAGLPRWTRGIKSRFGETYLLHRSANQIDSMVAQAVKERFAVDAASWWEDFIKSRTSLVDTNLPMEDWNHSRVGNDYLISGKIPRHKIRNAKMQCRTSGEVPFETARKPPKPDDWNFSRRIWAERQLANLEKTASESTITRFAIAERLVSDYTSLIVLERFQDHLIYKIPPPEPDLLEKYERQLKQESTSKIRNSTSLWSLKKSWHQSSFNWFDIDLKNQLRTVGIWTKSSRVAFPDKKLNKQPIEAYEKWYKTARETILRREKIETGKEFKTWLQKMDSHIGALHKIRETTPANDDDEMIHVSVRGFTRTRGIFSGTGVFALEDAIEKAGGSPHHGALNRVFLYRDARRTGYNLLSKDYFPVPLKWGDMIVVEGDIYYESLGSGGFGFSGPVDPFADAASDPFPGDRGEGPAVFEEPGTLGPPPSDDTFSEKKSTGPKKVGRHSLKKAIGSVPIDGSFFDKLEKQEDPAVFLDQSFKAGVGSFSEIDLIRIAMLLHRRKQTDKAKEVLWNLFEVIDDPITATRIIAYWYGEFGDSEGAERLLLSVFDAGISSDTKALLYFDIGQIKSDPQYYRKAAETAVNQSHLGDLFTIALSDYFNGDGATPVAHIPAYKMFSDIRVVLTGIDQAYGLKVDIPAKYNGVVDNRSIRQVKILGITEHQTLKAMPGVATVKLQNPDPGTYRVRVIQKFGSENEKVLTNKTILITKAMAESKLAEIDFSWKDIEVEFETPTTGDEFDNPFGE